MNPDPNQPQQPIAAPDPNQPQPAEALPVADAPVETPQVPTESVAPVEPVTPVETVTPIEPVMPLAPAVEAPAQPVNPFFNAADTPLVSSVDSSSAPFATPPVVPIVPVVPLGSSPVVGGVPTPKKTNKKLALIIGAGAALLLIVAAALVYFIYFNITKADYQKAVTASSELVTLEAKSRDSLKVIVSTDDKQPAPKTVDEVTKIVKSATDDFTAYQTSVKAYDKQKALRDGDVSKAYKAFKTKYDAYQTYTLAYTQSIGLVLEASVKCSDAFKEISLTDTYDAYKKQSDVCRAALVSAQDTNDADWKSFVTAYIAYLDATLPIYKDFLASFAAKDYTAGMAAAEKLTPISKKFTDESKKMTENINKNFKATEGVASSFKTVTDLLDKKAKQ